MHTIVTRSRIPYEYFVTKGSGQSNAGSKNLPFETGSYDAALNDAGIENANIVKYTSVIPTRAKEIPRDVGVKKIVWGEALESIMAQANGKKGDTITAAVMITTVESPTGKYLGGFACEYSASGTKKDVEESLLESITGMIERRGYGTMKENAIFYKKNTTDLGYKFTPGSKFAFETLKITEDAGTALAAICFTTFHLPIVENAQKIRGGGKRTRKRRK